LSSFEDKTVCKVSEKEEKERQCIKCGKKEYKEEKTGR
jgi:hypothetical protein